MSVHWTKPKNKPRVKWTREWGEAAWTKQSEEPIEHERKHHIHVWKHCYEGLSCRFCGEVFYLK